MERETKNISVSADNRLEILTQAMLKLAKGDLTTRIDMSGDDEISRLALGFNIMAERLEINERKIVEQIQQQKQILEDLAKTKQKAEAANKAKSQFLANMSHELRTPLNAILGFTQVLIRNSVLNLEQQQQLEIIERSGEHLLQLLNNILEMSKIEAQQLQINESSFDFYYLLSSLQEMLGVKAEAKGLELLVIYEPNTPRYIKTDEGKLRQILINLIGNGIKFTAHGGVILRIKLAQKSQEPSHLSESYGLYFEIQDTGFGIAPEEMDQLFTAFSQTEIGRKSEEGTGLGLSISQKFVQLLGGEISVSSQCNQGTIFSFEIPIKIADSSEVATTKDSRSIIGLEPGQPEYRILAVDDRAESRMVLRELLKPLGFQVKEAANGLEAVQIWETWQPHLIWMDMRMPIMNGYEATQKIKAHIKGQATAIIALTASAFEEERAIILSAGCDDFLRKPFHATELLEKIAEHLGVRFIYQENNSAPSHVAENLASQNKTSVQSALEQLEIMSVDWLTKLNQAAELADDISIQQLIEEITLENNELAEILNDWLSKFRVDKIVDVTHQALSKQ